MNDAWYDAQIARIRAGETVLSPRNTEDGCQGRAWNVFAGSVCIECIDEIGDDTFEAYYGRGESAAFIGSADSFEVAMSLLFHQ